MNDLSEVIHRSCITVYVKEIHGIHILVHNTYTCKGITHTHTQRERERERERKREERDRLCSFVADDAKLIKQQRVLGAGHKGLWYEDIP